MKSHSSFVYLVYWLGWIKRNAYYETPVVDILEMSGLKHLREGFTPN